jgi:hypothetical protein
MHPPTTFPGSPVSQCRHPRPDLPPTRWKVDIPCRSCSSDRVLAAGVQIIVVVFFYVFLYFLFPMCFALFFSFSYFFYY